MKTKAGLEYMQEYKVKRLRVDSHSVRVGRPGKNAGYPIMTANPLLLNAKAWGNA